jgi:thioredoxin reductase
LYTAELAKTLFIFVVTDMTLQTSIKGVFAAGDVRAGATAQAASADEGATAVLVIRQHLESVSVQGVPALWV